MRIRPLPLIGLLSALAAGCAHRSAIAVQPLGPAECGSYIGSALVLNGRVIWTTESPAEMREWLSRIDSTDVLTMVVRTGAEAAAIYGARGADGVVEVTLGT